MTPGTVLAGRYRLDRPIDRGGMGQVWAGADTVLERDVAVKVMHVGTDDAVAAGRFRREAQATAALSHPNVVTIFDLGVDGSVAFLVMELLPGPTLAMLVTDLGPLPVFEALLLTEQAAAGLSAAHQAGVVHRDVKPSNLMLDADNRLKVVDFGIARLAQSTSGGLTAANTLVGSAHYLSPEQAEGSDVDQRTDLYALGCVLMTLLTGEPPFAGEHPLAVLHQHLNVAPPRLSGRRADVPPELDALVAQLLAKAPGDRPATADETRFRLHTIRQSLAEPSPTAVLAAPTEALAMASRVAGAGQTAPTMTLGRAQLRQRRSSTGRAKALGAAAVAVAALVTGWLVFGTGGQSPGPAAARTPNSPTSSVVSEPTPSTTTSATPTATTATQAVAELRDAVTAAVSSGQLDRSRARDLLHRLDDVQQQLDQGDRQEAAKKLQDFRERLRELTRRGQLTGEAWQRIQEPLTTLQSLLPEPD